MLSLIISNHLLLNLSLVFHSRIENSYVHRHTHLHSCAHTYPLMFFSCFFRLRMYFCMLFYYFYILFINIIMYLIIVLNNILNLCITKVKNIHQTTYRQVGEPHRKFPSNIRESGQPRGVLEPIPRGWRGPTVIGFSYIKTRLLSQNYAFPMRECQRNKNGEN